MWNLEQFVANSDWLTMISRRLQLDRPLLFALAAKLWQAITGPITLMLVITAMSLTEQGVYYGLVSIVGIQSIFELGLLNVLISHAGNQAALLPQNFGMEAETAVPNTAASEVLASQRMSLLIRSSRQWFTVASLLFVLVGCLFGWYTLSGVDTQLDWWSPLLTVLPLVAITIALAPSLAILEGAGFRESVYRFRLFQMVSGSLLVWLALLFGFKLWTVAVAACVQVFWAGYAVYGYHANFFARFRHVASPADGFTWLRDVVPMQWRAAAISVAQYLSNQMFVLIVLGRVASDSAIDAGRLGPTLTITSAIQMLALVWVQTKYPVVSAHHGVGEREQAGTLWRHTALLSTGLLCVALGALLGLIASLKLLGQGYENNFIQPWQLAVLSLGYIANHLLALQSYYVMARRANPFWLPLVFGLLTTAAAVWICGRAYSTSGLVIAYAVTTALVTLPLHSWAYLQFRARK